MALIVASERLGKIGDVFDAEAAELDGVNVPALIEGGHLTEEAAKKKNSDNKGA
jgi:hypothetical protein